MDRIIYKTQALVVGQGADGVSAARAALEEGAKTMLLDAEALAQLPPEVEGIGQVALDKIILYPEGRVAGVMGHRTQDGRKVIVNCDAVLLTREAAKTYEKLCLQFGGVLEDGTLRRNQKGLLQNEAGKDIGGVFVVDDPAAAGRAGGSYAVFVDETIYARFRAHPMVHREPELGGVYYLTILGMHGVPKHKITLKNENGTLSGTHETENDCQVMQNVRMEHGYLCWDLWSGTTSSELFTFQLKPYGDMLLGGTWRIDMENAHRTPVMMEPIEKRECPEHDPGEKEP